MDTEMITHVTTQLSKSYRDTLSKMEILLKEKEEVWKEGGEWRRGDEGENEEEEVEVQLQGEGDEEGETKA